MSELKNSRGSNSAHVRRFNECVVLHLLREREKASKADLARATHLTNAAIGGIIRALDKDGLIQEVGRIRDGSRGQPATLLKLAATGAYGLGIHITPGRADVGLIDFAGSLISSNTTELDTFSAEETAEFLSRQISALLKDYRAALSSRIAGIGLSYEGLQKTGNDSLQDFLDQLCQALHDRTGYRTLLEEDRIATARAEAYFGKIHSDFAHIFVGDCLSGTFLVGDDLLRRAGGSPADLMHLPSFSGALPAPRPNTAPQAMSSPGQVPNSSTTLSGNQIPAQPQPTHRDDWPETCARAMAQPLSALMDMLNLQTVLVNGTGTRPQMDRFVRTLSTSLTPQSNFSAPRKDIRLGYLGENAALTAAAALPLLERYAPRSALLTEQSRTTAG
ncbi:hypothetical protein [Roseibium sp.]|uniref:hypothetical protein n=1 Tax=Roseibium sp. TaxID=1936156 RepID=UPI003A980E5C